MDWQIGIGLPDWYWIGRFPMVWYYISELVGDWRWIDIELALDWQWIGEGLAELADIGLAMDWHRIGF